MRTIILLVLSTNFIFAQIDPEAIDIVRDNYGIPHIFSKTDFSKIYLHTLKWNVRAQFSFQKSGFTKIREVSRDGKQFIYMEILKNPI